MEYETFFLVSQVLSFRHTKQTSKNVADTTFKSDVDKLDIGKLETVPTNLSKLNNVVDNVVIETVYNEFVKKSQCCSCY